ncbi:hypothetical protein EZS27_026078 [termite gut metagenome]|uniref:HTH cro/C1-type domain-containing protein n=1 Tax=termite gut metagenome TaxID=433724 RepID=A0A5J4QU17_9ZZZZ
MTINERFDIIIKKLYLGNKSAFAKDVHVSPTVIENVVGKRQGKPSYDVLEKICANANISIEWLFYGNGSMLREEQTSPQPVIYQENDSVYKGLYEKIYEENKALLQKIGKMGGEIEMLKKTNGQLKNEILNLREEQLQEQTESFTPNVAGSDRKTLPTHANIANAPFSKKRQNPQIEK